MAEECGKYQIFELTLYFLKQRSNLIVDMKNIELSEALASQLETYLKAFQKVYGPEFTMDRMISSLLSGVEEIHPEVMEELAKII